MEKYKAQIYSFFIDKTPIVKQLPKLREMCQDSIGTDNISQIRECMIDSLETGIMKPMTEEIKKDINDYLEKGVIQL